MLSDKQKKIATGVGLGSAATLGTVLAVRHHHKKSSHSHDRVIHYPNGIYCDPKTGKCHEKDFIKNTIHVMVDGYKDVLKHFLKGDYD